MRESVQEVANPSVCLFLFDYLLIYLFLMNGRQWRFERNGSHHENGRRWIPLGRDGAASDGRRRRRQEHGPLASPVANGAPKLPVRRRRYVEHDAGPLSRFPSRTMSMPLPSSIQFKLLRPTCYLLFRFPCLEQKRTETRMKRNSLSTKSEKLRTPLQLHSQS